MLRGQADIPGTSKCVIYAATHGRGYRLILGREHHGGGDDDN